MATLIERLVAPIQKLAASRRSGVDPAPAEEDRGAPLSAADRRIVLDQLQTITGLTNVETSVLGGLLVGARVITPRERDEVIFRKGEIPSDAFYVLLAGVVTIVPPGGAEPVHLNRPAPIGADELVHRRAMDVDMLFTTGRIARIDGKVYRGLLLSNPELRRAVARSFEGGVATPAAEARRSSVYVVRSGVDLADRAGQGADAGRVLRGLTALLGEAIATHLHDPVIVVHVVAKAPIDRDVLVEHVWLPRGPGARAVLEQAIRVHDAHDGEEEHEGPAVESLRGHDFQAIARAAEALEAERGEAHEPGVLVSLGRHYLVIHPLAADAARPRDVRVERRFRQLPEEGLQELLKQELGEVIDAGVVVLVDGVAPGDERGAIPLNVARLFDDPHEIEPGKRADEGVTIRTALLPEAHGDAEGACPAWPMASSRIRLPRALLSALDDAAATPRADARPGPAPAISFATLDRSLLPCLVSIERWARAITGRRVGLALGGGGPYGFVHAPFVRALLDAGVPIDMVSGSSMGSVAAAYFCWGGREGLTKFDEDKGKLLDGVLGHMTSEDRMQRLIDAYLPSADLNGLETPFFPVVTDALTGAEWDVREGHLGVGVRASAAMPPIFPPTRVGDRRYLDGGIVANVPSRVLRQEGASLVIASNPINQVERLARDDEGVAASGVLGHLSTRVYDTIRMLPMVIGALGKNQMADSHVVFRPRDAAGSDVVIWGMRVPTAVRVVLRDDLLGLVFKRVAGTETTDSDAELARAVNEAVNGWRSLLRNPPSRVYWCDGARATIALDAASKILFVSGSEKLDPSSFVVIQDLVEFMRREVRLARVTVKVRSESNELAKRRAREILEQLAARGVDVKARVQLDAQAGEDSFALTDVVLCPADEVAAREGQLAQAELAARVGTLVLAASEQRRTGDPDLARMLAIEAAGAERSPATEAELRSVLKLLSRRLRALRSQRGVTAIAWQPGTAVLAVGHEGGELHVWDTAPERGAPVKIKHGADVRGVAWSPDGRLLASAGRDRKIRIHAVDRVNSGVVVREAGIADAGTAQPIGPVFSPDGARLLASAAPDAAARASDPEMRADRCVGVWAITEGGLALQRLLVCPDVVRSVVWHPDGARVATGDDDGLVIVWDAATGRTLKGWASDLGPAHGLAWHPDGGARLAVARGAAVTVYDTDPPDGAILFERLDHGGPVRSIAWSPRGDRLLSASADGTARIWDAQTGALSMILRGEGQGLCGAAWHAGIDLVVTWDSKGRIVAWYAATGEPLVQLSGQRGAITAAAFGRDGDHLATGAAGGSTWVWDPSLDPSIFDAFDTSPGSPEGAFQRCRKPLNNVCWRPAAGPVIAAPFAGDATALGLVGGGDVLMSADDGAVIVWRPNEGRVAFVVPPTVASPIRDAGWGTKIQNPLAAAIYSPDGALAALIRRPDRTPTVLRADDLWLGEGAPRAAVLDPIAEDDYAELGQRTGYRLRWSPDGKYVAANFGRSAAMWRVSDGKLVFSLRDPDARTWEGDEGCVRWIAWHPTDGRFAIARWPLSPARGGQRTIVQIFRGPGDLAPIVCEAGDATEGAWCVEWSPDGARLAAGHADACVRIYDPATGRVVASLPHEQAPTTIAWSPDGVHLATGEEAPRASVWRRIGGEDRWEFVSRRTRAHDGDVNQVLWTADGERMISLGEGGSVVLWENVRGHFRTVASLDGHQAEVTMGALDPEQRRVVTVSADGIARVEPIDFDLLVRSVAARLGRREMTAHEWRKYMGAAERRPAWPRPEGTA